MRIFPEPHIRKHYAVHAGRPFFEGLVRFMSTGPVVAIALEGRNAITFVRGLLGKTDGAESPPGTIRGDFGLLRSHNLTHGSDSAEAAAVELQHWFGGKGEQFDWTPAPGLGCDAREGRAESLGAPDRRARERAHWPARLLARPRGPGASPARRPPGARAGPRPRRNGSRNPPAAALRSSRRRAPAPAARPSRATRRTERAVLPPSRRRAPRSRDRAHRAGRRRSSRVARAARSGLRRATRAAPRAHRAPRESAPPRPGRQACRLARAGARGPGQCATRARLGVETSRRQRARPRR